MRFSQPTDYLITAAEKWKVFQKPMDIFFIKARDKLFFFSQSTEFFFYKSLSEVKFSRSPKRIFFYKCGEVFPAKPTDFFL